MALPHSATGIACVCMYLIFSVLSQPAPSVLYQISPNAAAMSSLTATSPPAVSSSSSAFVCYRVRGGHDVLQFLNPSASSVGLPNTLTSSNRFVFPPIPVGQSTAIAFSADVTASFYVLFNNNAILDFVDRHGSAAQVAFSSELQLSFVPIGPTVSNAGESLRAYRVSTTAESIVWTYNFSTPTGSGLMSTPIYYRGQVVVNRGSNFYVINATTGKAILISQNPCNWTAVGAPSLHQITFGSDINGNLDAFLFANTTIAPQGTSVCRISHNTGKREWRTDYAGAQISVLDVTGANGAVVATAWVTSTGTSEPPLLLTWSMGASTGNHWASIERSVQDQFSFPALLAQPVGLCNQSLVLQVKGQLRAYCSESFNAPVWVSNYSCNHRPVVHAATNTIACVSRGASVHLIDSDGNLIWINDQIEAMFDAQVVGDTVWVVDLESTLWGLAISPSPTPLPPPYSPQGAPAEVGYTGGQVAGIVIGVLIACAAAAAIGFKVARRNGALRRNAEEGTSLAPGDYGGIS